MVKITWELPTRESGSTNDEIIHHKAKYHCFVYDDKDEPQYGAIIHSVSSLCNKHSVYIGMHDNIENGEIAMRPEIACKKCYKQWKKQFNSSHNKKWLFEDGYMLEILGTT